MRTGQLRIALFAFGVLAAVPAWGSSEWTEKLGVVSMTPVVTQQSHYSLWPAFDSSSPIDFLTFDDKDKKDNDDKDKGKKPPPPPPPHRSEKCPDGHGGDDDGHGNDGHDNGHHFTNGNDGHGDDDHDCHDDH